MGHWLDSDSLSSNHSSSVVSSHLLCLCAQIKYFVTSVLIPYKDIDKQTCSLYEIDGLKMSGTDK